MKKIKHITYFLTIFLFAVVGCGQQDKEDAERLDQINAEVEKLYNEEMTDLNEELTVEDFKESKEAIQAEDKEELNEENAESFEEIQSHYQNAVVMYELDEEIQKLFTDDILDATVDAESIEDLTDRLAEIDHEQRTDYVTRQKERVTKAEKQLDQQMEAKEAVDKLFGEDQKVDPEISREDEEATKEVVAAVKNNLLREKLEERLQKVNESLTQAEEKERKAREGVGYFRGMYLSPDNYILYIDDQKMIVSEYEANCNSFYETIEEIISNTGEELTVRLYHHPDQMTGTEGGTVEDTCYLSADHQTVTASNGREFHRINQEKQEEIFSQLPGLKKMIENNSPWN